MLVRLGVIVCVASATAFGAARLDDALGLFDWRADRNASLGYLERLYADGGVAGSRSVVQDALAWMPADATYRVVIGPNMKHVNRFTTLLVSDFLNYLLLPRRQTASESARWVFCYGCDLRGLGVRLHVLSDGRNGILFGRVRP